MKVIIIIIMMMIIIMIIILFVKNLNFTIITYRIKG